MKKKLQGKEISNNGSVKRVYRRFVASFIIVLLFVLCLTFIFAKGFVPLEATEGESANDGSSVASSIVSSSSDDFSSKKVIRLGIIQQLEHSSLEQVREYFLRDLEQYLKENNVKLEFELQNAQNDISNCQTIAVQFANKDLDLVLSLGTTASQAVAKEIKDKPIIAAAVTDPLSAKLLKSLDKPGGNLTAVSDLGSMEEQVKLIKTWSPDLKKIALLYSSNEVNSVQQIELMKEELKKVDLEFSDYTFSNSSELNSLLETAMQATDAIYIPSDNTLASSMALVHKLELQYKVPVIVAAQGMLEEGGLSCVGIDYRNLGSEAAKIAERVLINGEDIGEIPVKYLEDLDFMYREDTLNSIGIDLPSQLKDKAKVIK